MSSSDGKKGSQESRLHRALLGLPILALCAIMARALGMAEPIGPVLGNMVKASMFDWSGVKVPVLREFYGIGFLDDIFRPITVFFGQLQFFGDQRAYWQSLVFLTDFGGMYAILFFESLRPSNRGTLFQFPSLVLFLGQMIPIGLTGSLYFYLFYVFTPIEKLSSPSFYLMNWSSCAAVLPTVLLAHYVSHLPSFFHTSLEARHWWNWVWQLYPVWGSIAMLVFSKVVLPLGARAFPHATSQKPQTRIIRTTVGVLAVMNISIYWYTLYNSTFSMAETFVPQYFFDKPTEADVAVRTIIQYDYLCVFLAGYLWLGLHFRDLQVVGICKVRFVRTICIAAIISGLFSPGTFLLLAWLAREELLTSLKDD